MRIRTLAAACVAALALCAGRASGADPIPDVYYFATTGHYYKVYATTTTWASAKQAAAALGGYLSVVTSAAEHTFLRDTLGVRSKWLGGTDEASEGTWVWINGESWAYTAWTAGEPNNVGGEHYLSYDAGGGWNDLPANYNVGYVVEWDSDPNVTEPPQAPTSLQATATSLTRVDLSWTDNSTIEDAVEVERADGASGPFGALASLGVNVVTYADTTVLPGGTYRYRVRATNEIGPSAWSQEVSISTSAPPLTGLAATVLSNRTVELTWNDESAQETAIGVDRAIGSPPGAWTRIATLAADETDYVDSTVAPDTTYSYRLQATYAGGPFAPTGPVSVRTPPGDPDPSQPVVRNGTDVTLEWAPSTGTQTSYEVQRGIGFPGQDFQLIATLPGDRTSFVDSTTQPETTYSYRIRAVNESGPSEWSAEIRVRTPPFAPSALAPVVAGTSRTDLTWTDVSGIEDGYRVERRDAPEGEWARLADLPADTASYSDATARQDRRYRYRVASFDANGDSAWKETPDLATPAAMALDKVIVARAKAKPARPAKFQAAGTFDAGAAAREFTEPSEVRLGGAVLQLTHRKVTKQSVTLSGAEAVLVLKPSRTGSSRVAFTLTVTGDAAGAVPSDGTAQVWFVQPGFAASGAVLLKGDRFAPGAGRVADPALVMDQFAGALTPAANDRLKMRCRFAGGEVPDAIPEVTVQYAALKFTAAASQFVRKGDKLVFQQKQFGGRKIEIDYRKGFVTFSLAGIELGAFTDTFDPGDLIVAVGTLSFRDRPVLAVTKKSVTY